MNKICKQCGCGFEIIDDDLSFYDKISPVFNGVKYSIYILENAMLLGRI